MIDFEGFKKITPRPVHIHNEERGDLLKVLSVASVGKKNRFGEIYIVTLNKGAQRGEHYHSETNEWFFLIQGEVECILYLPGEDIKSSFILTEGKPEVVEVPAGVVHLFIQRGDKNAVILAYADRDYESDDPDTTLFPISNNPI